MFIIILLFWGSTRKRVPALLFNKHLIFLILPLLLHIYSPSVWMRHFSANLFKAPHPQVTQSVLIGQFSQAWATEQTAHCVFASVPCWGCCWGQWHHNLTEVRTPFKGTVLKYRLYAFFQLTECLMNLVKVLYNKQDEEISFSMMWMRAL